MPPATDDEAESGVRRTPDWRLSPTRAIDTASIVGIEPGATPLPDLTKSQPGRSFGAGILAENDHVIIGNRSEFRTGEKVLPKVVDDKDLEVGGAA